MIDHQLWGFWLFGLSVIVMIAKFELHRVLKLNVIKVMFISHIFLQGITATRLLFGRWDDINLVAAPTFFLAIALSALLIPIGGLIGRAVVPISQGQRERFYHQPIDAGERTSERTAWFLSYSLAAGVVLLGLYIQQWGSTPIVDLLSGKLWHPDDHVVVRRQASEGQLGFLFGWGVRFFMPFLFAMGIVGLGYFRTARLRMVSVAAATVALLYNAWATSKTPVATLFLLAALIMLLKIDELDFRSRARNLSRRIVRRARRMKVSLALAALVFTLLVVSYPVFVYFHKPIGDHGLLRVLEGMSFRIFGHPAFSAYIAFEAFSYSVDFTWFKDVRKLALFMNWEYFDMSDFSAAYQGSPPGTNSPPPAIGNFYAQGGWPVVIGGVLLASALFQVLENVMQRMRFRTVPQIALYVLLLHAAFRFSLANFHTIFLTESIVPICVGLTAWIVVARMRVRRREIDFTDAQIPEISPSSRHV